MRNRDIFFACKRTSWISDFRRMLGRTACSLRHVHRISPEQLRNASAAPFAVVLCEHTLGPDLLRVCRELRRMDRELILVTILDRPEPRTEYEMVALEVDDVVRPPVTIPVVAARLLLRIQRRGWAVRRKDFVDLDGVVVDFSNLCVLNNGTHHKLSVKRAQLLKYLLMNANRVVSKDEAYEQVWGDAVVDLEGKCLNMHVSKLRKVVEHDHKRPRLITTVHGRGYRLNLPADHPAIHGAPDTGPVRLNLPALEQFPNLFTPAPGSPGTPGSPGSSAFGAAGVPGSGPGDTSGDTSGGSGGGE